MRIGRGWLLAGAGLCLLLFVSFRDDRETEGDTTRHEIRVGVPGTPWFTFRETETKRQEALPGGGWQGDWSSSTSSQVEFFSGSWIALAAGLLLLRAARKAKEPAEPPPAPAPPA